jgi:hypothetical protein
MRRITLKMGDSVKIKSLSSDSYHDYRKKLKIGMKGIVIDCWGGTISLCPVVSFGKINKETNSDRWYIHVNTLTKIYSKKKKEIQLNVRMDGKMYNRLNQEYLQANQWTVLAFCSEARYYDICLKKVKNDCIKNCMPATLTISPRK